MIEKFTKEQEKLMLNVRDEWISKLRNTKYDEKIVEKNIKQFYSLCDLKEPQIFHLKSPLEIQHYFNMVGEDITQVNDEMMDYVLKQIWGQVESQLKIQVENQVKIDIWVQACKQVWGHVETRVGDQVWLQVKNRVGEQVRNQKLNQFYLCRYGDINDFGWVSHYDFMERIGVEFPLETKKKFNIIKELISDGHFTMIMGKNICAVCPMPKILKLDSLTGKLHDTKDYAIEWEDGYKLAFINGVYIDYNLFEKFRNNKLNVKEILKIKNIEQRDALMKEVV